MNIESLITVLPYGGQVKDDFVSLISNYSFGRYCSDWELDLKVSRQLELDQLFAYTQQNPTNSWLALNGHKIVGFLGVRESKWDTDFWGFRCANVDYLLSFDPEDPISLVVINRLLETVDQWCRREKIEFIVARADVLDLLAVHALEAQGFKFIETVITNSYNLKNFVKIPLKEYEIRHARFDEMELLVDMSLDGFATHRFYADKRFEKSKVDEMYREWVRNSLKNTSVWSTVVLEKESRVLGYMTYRIEDLTPYFGVNFTKWRMASLSKGERGKNHGVDLFMGAMEYVMDQTGIVDSGLTIRNRYSFNLHTKLNFILKCSSITFHKWYS